MAKYSVLFGNNEVVAMAQSGLTHAIAAAVGALIQEGATSITMQLSPDGSGAELTSPGLPTASVGLKRTLVRMRAPSSAVKSALVLPPGRPPLNGWYSPKALVNIPFPTPPKINAADKAVILYTDVTFNLLGQQAEVRPRFGRGGGYVIDYLPEATKNLTPPDNAAVMFAYMRINGNPTLIGAKYL